MTEGKPGIMLYYRTTEALENLDDGQFGRLVRAMLDYGRSGKEPKLEGILAAGWPFLKGVLDEDDERYKRVVERRRAAAYKRWNKEPPAAAKSDTDWMTGYIRKD